MANNNLRLRRLTITEALILGPNASMVKRDGNDYEAVLVDSLDGVFGPPIVSLDVTSAVVAEADGTTTVTAALTKVQSTDILVTVSYGGTATAGTDYIKPADTIVIPAGSLSATLDITVTDTANAESNETILISIAEVKRRDSTTEATITIVDSSIPVVTLSLSDSSISEPSGTSIVTATLSLATHEDVVVSLGYAGTATSGTDYETPAGSITITAGDTTGSTTITAADDAEVEGNETVIVSITGVSGGDAIENGTQAQTITLTDDDSTSLVSLTVSSNTIAEAAGTSIITATLDKTTYEDVVVTMGYAGTATVSTEYLVPAATITIPQGQLTGTATLTAVQDADVEGNETIIVTIASVAGGAAAENGVQSKTVTITDDDVPLVTLSLDTTNIAEAAGEAVLTATLSQTDAADVTVNLGYTGTATVVDDYNTPASSIVITAGQLTNTTTITAAQDVVSDINETIIIDITSVTGGNAAEDGTQQQTIVITDDEDVLVTLDFDTSSIAEAAGEAVLTATLSKVAGEDVVVNLTYGGTATENTDYTTTSSALTITAGQLTDTATVTATQDADPEAGETIIVTIASITGGGAAESGTQQASTTITDDEAITVSLSVSNATIAEAGGTSIITATLDKPDVADVTVNLGYTGTANTGSDYETPASSIVITTGNLTGQTTLTATQDADLEADETIIIDITSVTGGSATESGTQQVTVAITDDDAVTVALSVDQTTIAEAAATSVLTATLSAATFEDVVVNLAYAGTAISGTDYTTPASSITVTQGQTTGTLNLTATQDALEEDSETIIVTIASVTGGNAAESGTQLQTVTITDDDGPAIVTLSVSSNSIQEVGGSSVITATLDKADVADVHVTLGYAGTATKGTDYETDGTINLYTAVSGDRVLGDRVSFNVPSTSVWYLEFSAIDLLTAGGTICSQNLDNSWSLMEFFVHKSAGSSNLLMSYCGGTNTFSGVILDGDHTYRIESSGTTVDFLRDGQLIIDDQGLNNNNLYEPAAEFKLFARSSGPDYGSDYSNFAMYDFDLNGEVTCAIDDGWAANPVIANTGTGNDLTALYFGESEWGTRLGGDSGITITAGQTTGTRTISTIVNAEAEGDETVIITIDDVTGGSAMESTTPQTQTIAISETVGATVTLSLSSALIAEEGGTSVLTATLSKVELEDIVVNLSYAGTATSGTDYSTPASSVTVAAGSLTAETTITSLTDVDVDASETIIITISSVTGGEATENGTQSVTITIEDDETQALVTLSVSDSAIAEAAGTSVITATLSEAALEDVVVTLAYTGTATVVDDYNTPSSTITVTAGNTTGSTTLTAAGDALIEGTESIIITVTDVAGGGAAEDGTQTATVYITDDDTTPVLPDVPPGEALPMYTVDSPFNTLIGSNPDIYSGSSTNISALVSAATEGYAPTINSRTWSVPVFMADADTPRYRVAITGSNTQYGFRAMLDVPIPDHARPADERDGHMTIIDLSTGYEWDFWRAVKESDGTWSTAWGNRIAVDSDGIYDTGSGCKASGFANCAGLIWPDEIAQGHIDHALFMALPIAASGGFVWPATSSDGWVSSTGAIPEGARLQLDPSLDLDTLGLSTIEYLMCDALQKYGCYVGDYSGSVAFYVVDPNCYESNPYPAGMFESNWTAIPNMPWSSFRVLDHEDPHWGPTGVVDSSIYEYA